MAVRRRLRWAATVPLAALLLTGCAANGSAGQRVRSQSAGDALTAGLAQWAPTERSPAPVLEGTTLEGKRFRLADHRGRVVVVNVWGSWCPPCRAEAPDLRRVSEETRAAGVVFVGIDTRDNDAAARAFQRQYAIPYPSVVDRDGALLLRFAATIPVAAVPSTLVVDKRGRIAARVIGGVTYATLRGLVDDTLAEPV